MGSGLKMSPLYGFRQKFDLSRSRLSALLEIGTTTIYRLEKEEKYLTGIRKVKLDALNKILAANPGLLILTDEELRTKMKEVILSTTNQETSVIRRHPPE